MNDVKELVSHGIPEVWQSDDLKSKNNFSPTANRKENTYVLRKL